MGTPSRTWGNCFVYGHNPGAIFVRVERTSVELPLDNISSLDGLIDELRYFGSKTWMDDETVANLRRALYDVLGIVAELRVLTDSQGGRSLDIERIDDGGSGITDRVMRPDILRRLRGTWKQSRTSANARIRRGVDATPLVQRLARTLRTR